MEFLKTLNSKQFEAVNATEGYVRVIAGAGSGKRGIAHPLRNPGLSARTDAEGDALVLCGLYPASLSGTLLERRTLGDFGKIFPQLCGAP